MNKELQNVARNILQQEFKTRLDKNSSYSLRAFAKSLDIDASSLSQFLRGKRQLTSELLRKYLGRLGVDFAKLKNLDFQKELDQIYPFQYVEDYEALSQWYYLAITECLNLKDFQITPQWLSKKLGVHSSLISQALNLLTKKKVLIETNNKWSSTWKNISTQKDEDVDEVALREHQKQLLKLAAESIDHNESEDKSHTAYVTAMDPVLIPKLKKRIAQFRRETAAWIEDESKNKTEIYCMQINLFPQTKKEKK